MNREYLTNTQILYVLLIAISYLRPPTPDSRSLRRRLPSPDAVRETRSLQSMLFNVFAMLSCAPFSYTYGQFDHAEYIRCTPF